MRSNLLSPSSQVRIEGASPENGGTSSASEIPIISLVGRGQGQASQPMVRALAPNVSRPESEDAAEDYGSAAENPASDPDSASSATPENPYLALRSPEAMERLTPEHRQLRRELYLSRVTIVESSDSDDLSSETSVSSDPPAENPYRKLKEAGAAEGIWRDSGAADGWSRYADYLDNVARAQELSEQSE